MTFDPSKVNGPDLIPTQILKVCAQKTAPILQRIYQICINNREVPRDWRIVNIIAVYKKRSKSIPANYRSV